LDGAGWIGGVREVARLKQESRRHTYGDRAEMSVRKKVPMSMKSLSGRELAPYRRALADQRALTQALQLLIQPSVADTRQSHGLHVTGRIVSADGRPKVCGDWYLTLPLPDGSLVLAVGDVTGHGLSAGSAMVELRYAMSAYASEGLPPAVVLTRLDRLLAGRHRDVMATAVVARYSPTEAEFTWASAGHPPILLAHSRGVAVLPNPAGALLGSGFTPVYGQDRIWLRPGERVICYTDGMIGREQLDEGIANLAGQIRRGLDKPGQLLDHLGWPTSSPRLTDDACVLVAERIR
jgi:serine phosphatase RsbU (regulator of sigma subunit)